MKPPIRIYGIAWLLIFVVVCLTGGCSTISDEKKRHDDDLVVSSTPHEVISNSARPTIVPKGTIISNHEASSTPTPLSTKQSATSVTIPTPPIGSYNLGTIYQFFPQAYAWSDLMIVNGELQFDDWSSNALNGYQLPYSPSNSRQVAFSHYSDQIAYWTLTNPSQFWISDVAYEHPRQIFVDTEGIYVDSESLVKDRIELRWSPDDRHIIVYMPSEAKTHLIYHVEADEIEAWYWLCQRVIISPKTNQLAVLCTLDERFDSSVEKAYAIVEWEKDIWYTSELPNALLSQALPDGTVPWRFSADGQQIAYFDPNDPGSHLLIADAKGNLRQLLPGSSLLQRDPRITEFESQYYESWPERFLGFFRWSRSGEQVLAHVLGTSERPCRSLRSSEDKFYESPCWQVVDLATGRVLWSDVDSKETLFRDEFEESTIRLVQAEFSPNGDMIVVRGQHFSDQLLAVIDLNTSVAYRLVPLPYAQVYWADTLR